MDTTNNSKKIRQYALITVNYWAFTLTDGALRMLVVLYFYQLGYQPLELALLFVFYEAFGVITNLAGGWLGARFGLNRTMHLGLFLQIAALTMLLVPDHILNVAVVMVAQALSGIAKDLNKMSAKSAIKLLVPADQPSRLFKWVALLTGSKNTLKGVGFFLGGLLLATLQFRGAILAMVISLTLVLVLSLIKLKHDIASNKTKPKFKSIFSKNRAINILAASRMFLFGSRDVWFVIALPVFLARELAWPHTYVGGFLAIWIIVYGFVQSAAPKIVNLESQNDNRRAAVKWAMLLAITPALIMAALHLSWPVTQTIVIGLFVFGTLFAINSALHSYLIVHYASRENVSLDVGFYYMANAMGRLIGTVLSGFLFQRFNLEICLAVSAVFVVIAALISLGLDKADSRL